MLVAAAHILAIAVVMAVWALAGKALLPRVVQRVEAYLFWSSALALGAGVTAVLVTGAVAFGVFGRQSVWMIAAFMVLVATVGALTPNRRRQGFGFTHPSRWRRLALAALAGLGLATLIATLAPPSSMDATVYHLRIAREFLRTGRWTEIPEVVQSYQPLYVQMLFAEAFGLWDDVFAALTHWALGIGAVLVAGAWSRRLGGSALLGMVIFGLGALFTWESTSAFIDLALTLFASLGLLWATRADEPGAVWLAAVFVGLASGSKLTGGVAALQAAVLVGVFSAGGRRQAWRNAGFLIAVAFALPLPWYLRNVWFTGNPVFPVGNVWLGLPIRPLAGAQYGYGGDLIHLLTSPFDIFWRGEPFDKGWAMGPAYFALVPLGIFVTWRTKVGRAAAGVITTWWLVWFFSSPQTRLLLPVLPTAAGVAAAGAVAALASAEKWLRRAATATLVCAAILGAGFAGQAVRTYGPAACGRESRAAFLGRMSWHYPAFAATNARLNASQRLAVIGADNLYYLEVSATAIREFESTESLGERGFTHLLTIHACSSPMALIPPRFLWRGRYRLRASRMAGGDLGEETCAELGTLATGARSLSASPSIFPPPPPG
jgi:hypothetical protein